MPKRIVICRILAATIVVLVAAGLAGSASAALKLVRVASGFKNPSYATSAPGSRDIFVVSQHGEVTRIHHGRKSTYLDIRGRVDSSGNEEGLLSIAFHPRFVVNRKLFVFYTDDASNIRIVQFRANSRGTKARNRTGKLMLRIRHPGAANHNGGQLQFGRNGRLYASVGDGGRGGDQARKLRTKLGKLIQLNVDRPNPKARVVAVGFRNPWRFSVDVKTGRLFIADVGQNVWEEIDVFRPGNGWLENYGWNRYEGNHLFDASNPLGPGRYVRPIHTYRHRGNRCSVTGGFMVRGGSPGSGRYFYGDYCTGEVWSFRYSGGRKTGFRREAFSVAPYSLSSFGLRSNGALLVVSQRGTIYRVAKR